MQRVLTADSGERQAGISAVLASIRDARARASEGWVRGMLAAGDAREAVRFECVQTLLVIDPWSARTLAAWRDEWDRCDESACRQRLARVIAEGVVGAIERPEAAQQAERDMALSALITAATRDLAGGQEVGWGDLVEALGSMDPQSGSRDAIAAGWAKLARSGNAPMARLCVRVGVLAVLSESQRARVLVAVMEGALAHGPSDAAMYEAAAAAASAMPASMHDQIRPVLHRAREGGDESLVLAILGGVLRSGRVGPETGAAVGIDGVPPEGWPKTGGGAGGADGATGLSASAAMAAVVSRAGIRRDRGPVDSPPIETMEPPAIFDVLAACAGDRGLPEALRVQAAWLALRAAGQERGALNRVLTHVEPLE
jgi:hypothetical protein